MSATLPPPGTPLGFGQYFTEHMVLARWTKGEGWSEHQIVKRADIPTDPAAAVLHYGQALFDGCKAYRGDDGVLRTFRLGSHLQRLADGCARLAMPPIDIAQATASIQQLLALDGHTAPTDGQGSIYLRPFMYADEGFLGVRPSESYLFMVILSPVGAYFNAGSRPLRLWVEKEQVRAAKGGLGAVKAAANYAASLLAGSQAKAKGYDQVLWLDAQHRSYLEEVGTMNVFLHMDGAFYTPPLDGTILGGITRASVIELLREAGHTVHEKAPTIAEVFEAAQIGTLKSLFGTGTAATIAPVGALTWGDRTVEIPTDDPVPGQLLTALSDLQRGRAADTHG